jgi:hypothetical protein
MSQPLKAVGVVVLAAVALAVVVPSGASAAMALPEFSPKTNATGSGGAASLLGPVAIKATMLHGRVHWDHHKRRHLRHYAYR